MKTKDPPAAPERFKLILQDARTDCQASAVIRLRGALKVLLRSFGLRCVRIEPDRRDEGATRHE
jgi:hypothetical protein